MQPMARQVKKTTTSPKGTTTTNLNVLVGQMNWTKMLNHCVRYKLMTTTILSLVPVGEMMKVAHHLTFWNPLCYRAYKVPDLNRPRNRKPFSGRSKQILWWYLQMMTRTHPVIPNPVQKTRTLMTRSGWTCVAKSSTMGLAPNWLI